MFTTRLLPHEEWSKMAQTEPYASQGLPNPDFWRIVVVEDGEQIVASCAVFDTVHWDVFNVRPAYQTNPAVARHLITASLDLLREHHIPVVHLSIPKDQPALAAMAERFGFVATPSILYVCPVPPKES